jgi:hypothetical protein
MKCCCDRTVGNLNLLEKNLEKILDLAGFNPKVRTKLGGYEVDVLLEYKTIQAIFECKQYRRGNLTVRNLIHEWTGKNEEIGADRVILVLVGVSVSEEDRRLAEKRDVTIWEGDKVDELLDKAIEQDENTKEEILTEAGLQSSEEIENRIENLEAEYNITKDEAMKYLQGEIDKETLELYSSRRDDYESKTEIYPQLVDTLDEWDKNAYVKNSRSSLDRSKNNHTEVSSKKEAPLSTVSTTRLVEFMIDHEIFDKDIARMFIQGYGQYNGNFYKSSEVRAIRKIADELGFGLKEFVREFGKLHYPSDADDYLKLLESRGDLCLSEVEDLYSKGYSTSQIKRESDKEDEERPEFEHRKYEEFKIIPGSEPASRNSTHLAICPGCGRERPVNVALHSSGDKVQCGGCNAWNEINNINQYK